MLACGHVSSRLSWLLPDMGRPSPLWAAPFLSLGPELYNSIASEQAKTHVFILSLLLTVDVVPNFHPWLPHHNGLFPGAGSQISPFFPKLFFIRAFVTATKMEQHCLLYNWILCTGKFRLKESIFLHLELTSTTYVNVLVFINMGNIKQDLGIDLYTKHVTVF